MKRTLVLSLLTLIGLSGLYSQVHDVAAVAFISPPDMVLRFTAIEPWVVVGNFGETPETFNVILDIYDDDDTQVYHNVIAGMYEPPDPGELATLQFPCWKPGELYEEGIHYYRKELIVSLDGDENPSNDTLVEMSYVGCDDTIGYEWDMGDLCTDTLYSAPEGYWKTYGTSYNFKDGVLLKGARVYLKNTDAAKSGAYGWELEDNPGLEVWESSEGCGLPDQEGKACFGICQTYLDGWNYAEIEGNVGPRITDLPGYTDELVEDLGTWIPSASDEGNIWFSVTTSAASGDNHGTGGYAGAGFLVTPGPTSCYSGTATSRSGIWRENYDHTWQGWDGHMDNYTIMVEPAVHLGFTPENPAPAPPCHYHDPHDLSIYRVNIPDYDYVEHDDSITAELVLGNLGRQAEPDDGSIPVEIFVVDWNADMDTTYGDTTEVEHIGWFGDDSDDPDTLFVEMSEWIPEGICLDWQTEAGYAIPDEDEAANRALIGRHYELVGLVHLGKVGPDLSDHCPYNDTCRKFLKCLLSHDVGVVDVQNEEGYEWGNTSTDQYPTGTEFTCIATVENFGFHEEHDVSVDLEIYDVIEDSLVFHNIQEIDHLDWRGNDLSAPYWIDVTFPTWTTPSEHWFRIECRTELDTDQCSENDEVTTRPPDIVDDCYKVKSYSLEVSSSMNTAPYTVSFRLPDQGKVKIGVFDVNGRKVTTLAERHFEPGTYFRTWSGKDMNGRKVAAGIYLVRMEAEGFTATEKIVVIE